jgi:hypothetical protein
LNHGLDIAGADGGNDVVVMVMVASIAGAVHATDKNAGNSDDGNAAAAGLQGSRVNGCTCLHALAGSLCTFADVLPSM